METRVQSRNDGLLIAAGVAPSFLVEGRHAETRFQVESLARSRRRALALGCDLDSAVGRRARRREGEPTLEVGRAGDGSSLLSVEADDGGDLERTFEDDLARTEATSEEGSVGRTKGRQQLQQMPSMVRSLG